MAPLTQEDHLEDMADIMWGKERNILARRGNQFDNVRESEALPSAPSTGRHQEPSSLLQEARSSIGELPW